MTSWSDPAFAELAALATLRAGLAFPPGREETAEAAIRHAMQRADVSDARRYLDLLTTGLLSSDGLLFELAVGETYFFRQREHFALIAGEILPDITRRGGDAYEVQVWSAGCSSGEEAYSLAIALADSHVSGHVLGTDVSDIALAKARVGVYRPWSLRGLEAADTRRLFSAQDRRWKLDDRYRGTVTFARHNLATDAYPPSHRPVARYDLILCRNVLMYLDEASVNRVAAGLAQSLADEGWLLTGASDPPLTHPDLCVTSSHDCVVYRRHPRVVAMTPPDHLTIQPDDRLSIDGSPTRPMPPNAPAFVAPTAPGGGGSESPELQQAHAALAIGSYDEAIRLTSGRHDTGSAIARVHALANAAGTVTALSEVNEQLRVHPMSASLHLLRALLLVDQCRFDDARQALRRVLYLDPGSRIARALSRPMAGSSVLPRIPGRAWPRIAHADVRDATATTPLTRADLDVLGAWSGSPV